jgi:hypothetical protein
MDYFDYYPRMPWIDYDPNLHGVVHTPDWRFHDHLGEASIRAVEHLPTKILFFPTCRVEDKFDLHFATTYEGSIPDGFDIALRAQEAMRFFCSQLKTTPEQEKLNHQARLQKLAVYNIELHASDPNDPVPDFGSEHEYPDDETAVKWAYYYMGAHRAPSAKIYRGDNEPRLPGDFVCEIRSGGYEKNFSKTT